MAFITADRVLDSSTSTGTGAFVVSGTPAAGYRTFSAVMSVGDTCYYSIQGQTTSEWEVGLGTYSSANTLTRTTVYSSSNSGSAVTFSAGTKNVMLTMAASRSLQLDAIGNVGIGTSTPSTKLNVVTSTQYAGIILSNGTYAVGYMVGNSITNDGGQLALLSGGTAKISILANGQTFFNGGNVGIANTSPGTLLTLGANGGTNGAIAFNGSTSGAVTIKSAAAAGSWSLTLPTTAGTNGYILQTDGSGITSWAAASGGISWQSVQTGNFTAVAGNAYPVNTTSAAITVTLPASPSAGNIVQLTDYAGTWATNNVTLNFNGSNFNGSPANGIVATKREAIAFVYIDATQGWLAYSGFNASTPAYTASYLTVAGGGGGGYTPGGGGGAGGLLTNSFNLIPGSVYSVVVGGGGAGSTSSGVIGTSGSSSTLTSITATIGGGGGGSANYPIAGNGASGGSGGGGSPGGTNGTGGSGTSGQGFAGGTSATDSTTYGIGGGGGGSSAVGSNATAGSGPAGSGGAGTASSITGSSVTYAGGGGGGGDNRITNKNGGAGGSGGGGAGGNGVSGQAVGTAGTANTGGGGGGGAYNAGTNVGGAGGSGVVILSVPTAFYSGTVTGSPTITTSGSNTIIKFTASGSYTA